MGGWLVERPSPGARNPPLGSPQSLKPDLAYRNNRWHYLNSCCEKNLEHWGLEMEGISLALRPTPTGQVGIFPEHWAHWEWIADRLRESRSTGSNEPFRVLHLFAYTGATTLAIASMGGQVTHVDASRPTVAWGRENCSRSGLTEAPIRWIVEDAAKFVEREVRRGSQYEGIVLDPPTYGHGTKSERWEIHRDLLPLLKNCWQVLSPRRSFVLLCGHSAQVSLREIAKGLVKTFGADQAGRHSIHKAELRTKTSESLDCGFASRFEFSRPLRGC